MCFIVKLLFARENIIGLVSTGRMPARHMPVLRLLGGDFDIFHAHGLLVAPMVVKCGDLAPNFTPDRCMRWGVGPKTLNFTKFWNINSRQGIFLLQFF